MTDWPKPCTLEGKDARIIPLSHEHRDELADAASDGDLHKLWYTSVPSAENMAEEIERRITLKTMCPFTIFDKSANKAVGMTTYMNIDAPNKRVEIGSTWLAKSTQQTPLNTECKLLLLGHAFEDLDCICVEFRTHFLNTQSRRAIERLGAKLDGILRSNAIMPNGTIRDTAVYSIIASEWPAVKANLKYKLENMRSR